MHCLETIHAINERAHQHNLKYGALPTATARDTVYRRQPVWDGPHHHDLKLEIAEIESPESKCFFADALDDVDDDPAMALLMASNYP